MHYFTPALVLLLLVRGAFTVPLAQRSTGLSSLCSCAVGKVPVSIDVKLPIDPASQPLNTTHLRRLHATYEIFGVFCQPSNPASNVEQGKYFLP